MEKHFIIGSHSMKKFFSDFDRIPFDLDLLIFDEASCKIIKSLYPNFERVDCHVLPPLYDYVSKYGITADVLLTLKCSHIFWPIKWEKTLFDINFMLDRGTQIIEPLFYELYEFWKLKFGIEHRSKLDVDSEKFFDNALKTYDHDLLHTFINPNSTYFKVLREGAEVDVDENRFKMLTFDEKIDLVREEIYVMAFERRSNRSYQLAYYKMLKSFLMKHAPIWEALFIIKNFKLLIRPEYNYFEKIQQGLLKQNTNEYTRI